MLKRLAAISVLLVALAAVNADATETIVFLRHGEKPSSGNGQLTCQGLNRALALPSILIGRYGTPDFVYAPDPNVKMTDPAGSFYYLRPIATIEPTVIRAVRSLNTSVGYNNLPGLESMLIKSSKANAVIFVAWEHTYLVEAVQDIMNAYGARVQVPAWSSGDYDSLYVVRLTYSSTGAITAKFTLEKEGLNGQSTVCPQ